MMKNNTNMMVSQHPHQFNQHSVYESDEHDGIESICSCTINMGYMNDQPEKQVEALPQMASYDYYNEDVNQHTNAPFSSADNFYDVNMITKNVRSMTSKFIASESTR